MNHLLHFKMEFLSLLSKEKQLHEKYTFDLQRIQGIEKVQFYVEDWNLNEEMNCIKELEKAWKELCLRDENLNLSAPTQKQFKNVENQIELLFNEMKSSKFSPQSNSSPVCYLGSPEVRKGY